MLPSAAKVHGSAHEFCATLLTYCRLPYLQTSDTAYAPPQPSIWRGWSAKQSARWKLPWLYLEQFSSTSQSRKHPFKQLITRTWAKHVMRQSSLTPSTKTTTPWTKMEEHASGLTLTRQYWSDLWCIDLCRQVAEWNLFVDLGACRLEGRSDSNSQEPPSPNFSPYVVCLPCPPSGGFPEGFRSCTDCRAWHQI